MDMAIAEAQAAAASGEVPVGAVIVCDGAVIARGGNCKESEADPTGHAEMAAIRAAARALGRWRLSDCTLYVTMEPCPMCAGAILQARIGTLVFGAWDPRWGGVSSKLDVLRPGRFNHTVAVVSGIREAACTQLAKDFFQQIRSEDL